MDNEVCRATQISKITAANIVFVFLVFHIQKNTLVVNVLFSIEPIHTIVIDGRLNIQVFHIMSMLRKR